MIFALLVQHACSDSLAHSRPSRKLVRSSAVQRGVDRFMCFDNEQEQGPWVTLPFGPYNNPTLGHMLNDTCKLNDQCFGYF